MTNTVVRRSTHDWLQESSGDTGTVGLSIIPGLSPATTRTAAALLTEDAGEVRNRARALTADAGEVHQRTYLHEWEVLTQQRIAQGPGDLINELGDIGFAWRDIARLVGVSVPAIQKWRRGERMTGENRRRVARLIAACDFILSHYYVNEDVASWFETPVHDGAPLTPIDLWSKGQSAIFFDYATRHITPEEALNQFDPEWRERYRSDFETFRDADGNVGIRASER